MEHDHLRRGFLGNLCITPPILRWGGSWGCWLLSLFILTLPKLLQIEAPKFSLALKWISCVGLCKSTDGPLSIFITIFGATIAPMWFPSLIYVVEEIEKILAMEVGWSNAPMCIVGIHKLFQEEGIHKILAYRKILYYPEMDGITSIIWMIIW